ncbi:hypothetical protein QTO34_003907 [Cnephaeus nilssonii]|uniref:Uncharacterized protein n=1 Tax=Cnephaeus nilssonii TaxID=3371016 RepID=A0AA40LL13_CNENI|nr:hypothetical protein QTO34_003907 [Eptesicus nilssonii]
MAPLPNEFSPSAIVLPRILDQLSRSHYPEISSSFIVLSKTTKLQKPSDIFQELQIEFACVNIDVHKHYKYQRTSSWSGSAVEHGSMNHEVTVQYPVRANESTESSEIVIEEATEKSTIRQNSDVATTEANWFPLSCFSFNSELFSCSALN